MVRRSLSRDTRLLIAGQAVRGLGYGFTAVVLGSLLAARGVSPVRAGVLLATLTSVAEHLFRCFSQLQPGGQDRRRLNRLELGLFDGSLDFRPSATGTDNYTRLPQRLDSTPAARRLPVALTQASSRANNPAFGSFDHPVAMLDCPLPCLIRALPAVTGRDQLVCRH